MSGRKLRSNKTQIRVLVDFMSTNTYLATGEFTGPLGTRKAEAQWLKLKELLKNYGPDRSIEQWKQTWKDLKKNARHENALQATRNNTTGNAVDIPIVSENTKKIMDTIGHESSTGVGPAESAIGSFSGDTEIIPFEVVVESTAPFPPPVSSPPLPQSFGFMPEDEENVPPSTSHTPRAPRHTARPAHQTFAQLQQENNAILQNIALLMAERNQLLREQNMLMAEANSIAKRNCSRRLTE